MNWLNFSSNFQTATDVDDAMNISIPDQLNEPLISNVVEHAQQADDFRC